MADLQEFQHWFEGEPPKDFNLFCVGMTFNGLLPWVGIDMETLEHSFKGVRAKVFFSQNLIAVMPTEDGEDKSQPIPLIKYLWVYVYAKNASSALAKTVMGLGSSNFDCFKIPDPWNFDSMKTCRVTIASEDDKSQFYLQN